MNKQELLAWIESLPDDIQVFSCDMEYDALDIRIFTVPKDKDFISWYFGP